MNKKMMVLTLACYMVPVIGLAAIFLFHVPVSSVLWIGLVLLCPLTHILMMRLMDHEHEEHHIIEYSTNYLYHESQ